MAMKKSTPAHNSDSLTFVRRSVFSAVLVACVVSAAGARAEELDIKTAMPLLLKVLTYDVNFDARGSGDFVILVASEPAAVEKRKALMKDLEGATGSKVKARPVRFVSIDLKDEVGLQADIDKVKAAAVLAAPA